MKKALRLPPQLCGRLLRMISSERARAIGILCALALPSLALAHHGVGAQFDLAATIELQGEVRTVLWRNPHVRFTVAVTDEQGQEALWEVEAQSVSMLRQRDITDVLLRQGDRVRLAGNPSRQSATELYVTNLLLADGRELVFSEDARPRWGDEVLGLSGPRFAVDGVPADPERGIFKVWSRASGMPLLGDFSFANHPLTDTARAAQRAFDPLRDLPRRGDCIQAVMPAIVFNPYPRAFSDEGETIQMHIELYDTVRTIHMESAPAPDEPASPLGYSVGRWDGASLVVTTTKISSGSFGRGIGLSDSAEVLERVSPSDDGSRLDYTMKVTDPAAFLEPVEIRLHWIYIPRTTVAPYECVEG